MSKIYYIAISQYGRVNKRFRLKKTFDKFVRDRENMSNIRVYKVKNKMLFAGMFYQTKTGINKIKF